MGFRYIFTNFPLGLTQIAMIMCNYVMTSIYEKLHHFTFYQGRKRNDLSQVIVTLDSNEPLNF